MRPSLRFAKYHFFLAALLSILAPCGAWGTTYLSWKADSAATSVGSCGAIRSATFDPVERHEGAASLKLTVPGNQQMGTGCVDAPEPTLGSGSDGAWLYYRWWMKMSPSFSWGNSTAKMKSARIKRLGDLIPPIYTMYLADDSVYVGECIICQKMGNALRDDPSDARISYDFRPQTNPDVTNWQEYIIGVKKQSCVTCFDGEYHLWVNGVEIGAGVENMRYCDSTNCLTWVAAWGTNMNAPYPQLNGTASDGGIIWLDDFSLDNAWNSTFGAPPSSGTPPPSNAPPAPSGLTLR